jgi:hypothetical protein
MTREKSYKVLTTPGLSIYSASNCKDCINLTSENTCQIWAFPGEKWKAESGCDSYRSYLAESSDTNSIGP